MTAKIRITNITFPQKRIKDYYKPFRFSISITWEDSEGREHGFECLGCVGGVGRDGIPEWRGTAYFVGRRLVYNTIFMPGTYDVVMRALSDAGYFVSWPAELITAGLPVPASEAVGLPDKLEI